MNSLFMLACAAAAAEVSAKPSFSKLVQPDENAANHPDTPSASTESFMPHDDPVTYGSDDKVVRTVPTHSKTLLELEDNSHGFAALVPTQNIQELGQQDCFRVCCDSISTDVERDFSLERLPQQRCSEQSSPETSGPNNSFEQPLGNVLGAGTDGETRQTRQDKFGRLGWEDDQKAPSTGGTKLVRADTQQQRQRLTCTHAGCTRQFQRKHHLVSHLVSHTTGKPFACPLAGCCARFRRSQDMRRHVRKVAHVGVGADGCERGSD